MVKFPPPPPSFKASKLGQSGFNKILKHFLYLLYKLICIQRFIEQLLDVSCDVGLALTSSRACTPQVGAEWHCSTWQTGIFPLGHASSLESHRGQGVLKMWNIHLLPEPQTSLNTFQKFLHLSSLHVFFFPYRKLLVWISAYRIGSLISISVLIVNRRTVCTLERTNNHECGGLLAPWWFPTVV